MDAWNNLGVDRDSRRPLPLGNVLFHGAAPMNFAKAKALAADGAMIRRKLWDSWLAPHPMSGVDCLMWQLPKSLHKEYPRRGYDPHATDKNATDWEARWNTTISAKAAA